MCLTILKIIDFFKLHVGPVNVNQKETVGRNLMKQ